MNEKGKKLKGYLLSLTLLASIFIFSMGIMPSAQAQIVIIGSPSDDLPADYLTDAKAIAAKLKAKGYTGNKLVELYGKNATSTNILKAMYNADAVIYIGHGGYQAGRYDGKGGTASPPFSLVGYAPSSDSSGNEFIWGIENKMRQGWSGSLFTAPLKSNSAAFLFHACFSTGDVGGTQVKNSAETIYNFSRMFTGAGASYYASAYYGGSIIQEFLDGATSLYNANSNLDYYGEKLNTAAIPIGGTNIWRSNDHSVAFTGNWAYKFPGVSEVTDYDPVAAEKWYNDKPPVATFTASSYNPAVWQYVTFTATAYDPDDNDSITSMYWNFGDGATATGNSTGHSYAKEGYYKVSLTATDTFKKSVIVSNNIKVGNPKPDLVITSIKRSGSTRYIKIKNQGTLASSGSYVRIWNGKYSYKRYKQAYVKALSPGASTTVKITRFYYYHGKAKVDYYNKVSEKSEANNIRSI